MTVYDFFMYKQVKIRVGAFTVTGKLIRYQFGQKKPHRPFVLIVELAQGRAILREWESISTLA